MEVGVKAGYWGTYNYVKSYPEMVTIRKQIEMKIISVEEASVALHITITDLDSSVKQEQNSTISITAGNGISSFYLGLIIPPNLTTDNSVYITPFGNKTIAGETSRSYANMQRTIVYTSFSSGASQFTYYWDKQTRVLMELSVIYGSVVEAANLITTNMWQAQSPELYVLAIMILPVIYRKKSSHK